MPADTKPTRQALQDCRDVLATAAALGMPIPGIPGMLVYSADIFIDGEIEVNLGIFADKQEATRAVALWAIREMYELGSMMGMITLSDRGSVDWDEDVFRDWVQATSSEDVVDTYFTNQGGDSWSVQEVAVKPRVPQGPLSIEEAFPA